MKKILIISTLILSALSQEIFACQCVSNPPFLTAIKSENTKTIALVKIRKYLTYDDHPHGNTYVTSMEVEIEELYKGKEERKRVIIWGTQGFNCLEYLSLFQINKSYVVAIFERGNSEYNLSNCGEYWLSVEREIAKGRITDDKDSILLEDLKKKIAETNAQNTSIRFSESFYYSANQINTLLYEK